jgi:hypothetical protein
VKSWDELRKSVIESSDVTVTAERSNGFAGKSGEGYPFLVEQAAGSAVPWLVVRVPVCKQTEMDPVLVLERNGTLAFATLLLMQGAYWLRVAVPFDSAELGSSLDLVNLCIDAAKSLNPNRVEAVESASAIFKHWVD